MVLVSSRFVFSSPEVFVYSNEASQTSSATVGRVPLVAALRSTSFESNYAHRFFFQTSSTERFFRRSAVRNGGHLSPKICLLYMLKMNESWESIVSS